MYRIKLKPLINKKQRHEFRSQHVVMLVCIAEVNIGLLPHVFQP